MGWEQAYKVTGASQQTPSSIVRVYDAGTDSAGSDGRGMPLLLNVTSAGHDAIVGDSMRYYLNSCCPATHGHKLCVLGGTDADRQGGNNSELPHEDCFYTDISAFDMGTHSLTAEQRLHLLGGSASMWTDAYCASNECGAWPGPVPMAGWMADSPAHDRVFHDSLLASIFPAASVSAGAFYRYKPMGLAELNARWQAFNAGVLLARGVRSCANGCQCAEDNFCGKAYSPADYPVTLEEGA